MAIIGVVFYADDPERKVFRRVQLTKGETAAEFHNPKYVTEGCDPLRQAMLIQIDDADLHKFDLSGTP